jgi:hypothetical protein
MPRLGALLLAIALIMPAAAADGAPAEDGKKRVCRPAAAPLGSRIKRAKICRSASEWDELDASRRAADIPIKPAQPNPWDRTRPQ